MDIRSLHDTPLSQIVECLLISFEDYFVTMPSDIDYWRDRFKAARVDLRLSFGAFHGDQLVGFIIHGIDHYHGLYTAFNTGTGVIPQHRGQQVVDQIYQYAIPLLRAKGIEQCALEVIQKNHRAIRVYQRMGFHIQRHLLCFKGNISLPTAALQLTPSPFEKVQHLRTAHNYYSWDNVEAAVKTGGSIYNTYLVASEGRDIGFFTLNLKNGYVAQFEAEAEDFPELLAGIQQIRKDVRINNVDQERAEVILFLLAAGLENHIDQYEMAMKI